MASTPARSNIRTTPSGRRSTQNVVMSLVVTGFVLVCLLGLWGYTGNSQQQAQTPSQPPHTASTASIDRQSTKIVISSPKSDDCHQYQLDNVTGGINDQGITSCESNPGNQGTRVQVISRGFRNR